MPSWWTIRIFIVLSSGLARTSFRFVLAKRAVGRKRHFYETQTLDTKGAWTAGQLSIRFCRNSCFRAFGPRWQERR